MRIGVHAAGGDVRVLCDLSIAGANGYTAALARIEAPRVLAAVTGDREQPAELT